MMMAGMFLVFILFMVLCDFLVEMTIGMFMNEEKDEEQIEEIRDMRKKRYERFTK